MARQYVINANLGDPDKQDVNSQNPYWILLTFPYKVADSFNRKLLAKKNMDAGVVSTSTPDEDDNARATKPILFDSEVQSWSVQMNKDSHAHTLSATLFNVKDNLSVLSLLNPGDWCMFWAFQDRDRYTAVKDQMVNSHAVSTWSPYTPNPQTGESPSSDTVTGFSSGLKFIGKINSIQHVEARSPSGELSLSYNLAAYGFQELDAQVYFDEILFFKNPEVALFFSDVGVPLEKFLNDSLTNPISIDKAIPATLKVFLGSGIPDASLKKSTAIQHSVPKEVLKLLCPDDYGDRKFYADLLQVIIGNQSYEGFAGSQDYTIFVPDGDYTDDLKTVFVCEGLNDSVILQSLDFNYHSAWDIANFFLCAPINEMYTALRPHPDTGFLLPTLIVRRNPYGTDSYLSSDGALNALSMAEYPQWIVPSQLISTFSIGKSDVPRTNYVHVKQTGLGGANSKDSEEHSRVLNPPVVNKIDITRNGGRIYDPVITAFVNVGTTDSDSSTAPSQYTNFMADIMMDAHLRFSGHLEMVGVQDPVCVGDNVIVSNFLFHIETVAHSGGIAASGSKFFTTTLHLSHGVPLNLLAVDQNQAATAQLNAGFDEASNILGIPELQSQVRDIEDAGDLKDPNEDAITTARNNRTDLDVGLISRSAGTGGDT